MDTDKIARVEFWPTLHRFWHWTAYDATGRKIGGDHRRGGYARLDQCRENAETITGAKIVLEKVGGVYRRGHAEGRGFAVQISRDSSGAL